METKQNVYSIVYHSLVIGMVVSCSLFVVGVALQMAELMGKPLYSPEPLMKAGVIAMILTPFTRVVVSTFAFAVDRDFAFVGITITVLASMIASVLLGMHGV